MNYDLQASNQILSLLESSKNMADRTLDQLSGIYITCNLDGQILRANIQTARYLKMAHEDLLGISVSTLFKAESEAFFRTKFKEVAGGLVPIHEFELMLDGVSDPQPFLWEINPIEFVGIDRTQKKTLINIVAKNISELKLALARVFNLEKDLELARAVQSLLLPPQNFYNSKQMALEANYEPAQVAGGDWWFFQTVDSQEAMVLLGDVTGHGAGSAMVMSMVSGAVKAIMEIEKGKQKQINFDSTPIFDYINKSLNYLPGQPYGMTLFSLSLNFKTQQLVWNSAAAPPVFHLKTTGDVVVYQERSRPLGSGDLNVSTGREKFSSGDRFMLFTDGTSDVENLKGETLGQAALMRIFGKTEGLSISEAKIFISDKISQWRGETPFKDDSAFILADIF